MVEWPKENSFLEPEVFTVEKWQWKKKTYKHNFPVTELDVNTREDVWGLLCLHCKTEIKLLQEQKPKQASLWLNKYHFVYENRIALNLFTSKKAGKERHNIRAH